MTAMPESRLPLVLADSVLPPSLVVRTKRRGDDDSGPPFDLLHPGSHNYRRQRFQGKTTLCPGEGQTPQEHLD